MKRPSITELAKTDLQLARFLERKEQKAAQRAAESLALQKPQASSLLETRDLSPAAAAAINQAILGK